jgi:dolichyl-phosphate-mannose--protein O-mannosyl transferase
VSLNVTDPPAPVRLQDTFPAGRCLQDPAQAFSRAALIDRLLGARWSWRSTPVSLRLWYWLVPVLTAALGGVLRFVRLDQPHALVFDETYYVKDAYSLLQSGYERNWAEKSNDGFLLGNFSGLQSTPEYVVHPPVGKWMIAAGMQLFGPDSSFGWRFSSAVAGTLAVLMIALIAQKLFGSTLLGGVAGLLLAVDGHAIVQSRTALLDVFVMFWALAAFGALLLDRTSGRLRLAARLAATATESGRPPAAVLTFGPWLGLRPWRILAGICLGLCAGTKWSGLFFLVVFGLLTVLWDLSARRIAGVRRWLIGGLLKDGLSAFLAMVPVAALTYLASWTGWFLSGNSYDRNWAQANPSATWGWVPDGLRSLWHYHSTAYNFHTGLSSDHPYKANAWSWLVMGRPTSFYTDYPKQGEKGCLDASCAAVVSSVGNPLIWWCGTLAALFLLFYWLFRRDWRAGGVLAGWAAGYLPWLLYPTRTIFFFYAIAYEPYLVLGLVFVLGLVLGRTADPPWRRQQGALFAGIFLVLVLLLSAYFYPLWTAQQISYQDWRNHMWMPSWV